MSGSGGKEHGDLWLNFKLLQTSSLSAISLLRKPVGPPETDVTISGNWLEKWSLVFPSVL